MSRSSSINNTLKYVGPSNRGCKEKGDEVSSVLSPKLAALKIPKSSNQTLQSSPSNSNPSQLRSPDRLSLTRFFSSSRLQPFTHLHSQFKSSTVHVFNHSRFLAEVSISLSPFSQLRSRHSPVHATTIASSHSEFMDSNTLTCDHTCMDSWKKGTRLPGGDTKTEGSRWPVILESYLVPHLFVGFDAPNTGPDKVAQIKCQAIDASKTKGFIGCARIERCLPGLGCMAVDESSRIHAFTDFYYPMLFEGGSERHTLKRRRWM
ncbi:hypothetical protein LXL04_011957 [Taraxacum kok-saghyz]